MRWAADQPKFMLLGKLGTPSGSANLRWEQWGEHFVIRLWGPMGQATTLITGDVRRVVLERADGGARRVGDPSVILNEELGWEIPIGALSYWVRGVPAPGVEPTNNLAEQAIRFVVIDRHITQGTRSEKGQRWSERIGSVIASGAQQGRSVWEYLCGVVESSFQGETSPSLLVEG